MGEYLVLYVYHSHVQYQLLVTNMCGDTLATKHMLFRIKKDRLSRYDRVNTGTTCDRCVFPGGLH
jgi:hypothetical protein